jgi:cbb3-type cytochrome oxidase subunit 3
MDAEIISGVNNNLLLVHICYIIALVYFVFRNGEKKGVQHLCQLLIEEKVVTESALNKLVDKEKKKK